MNNAGPKDAEALTLDRLLGGRVRLWQPRKGFRAGPDAVLLAAAVPVTAGQAVLDLGCGVGTVALCLAARVGGLSLAGLERDPLAAALARRNAAENAAPLEPFLGDVAAPPAPLHARSFDHVVANPPFFPPEAPAAPDPARAAARRQEIPLARWIETARRRLRPRGYLHLILSATQLPEALAALEGFGGIEVKPLAGRAGRAAGRVILRARKGGRAPFVLHPPLVLHEGDRHAGDRESFRPCVQEILRDAAPLPFTLC